MDQTYPKYQSSADLIKAALAVGYKMSTWAKHLGHKCPECGKPVAVFYHLKDRSKPKVAACTCGWRKKLQPVKPKDFPQTTKVVSKVHQCRAMTKKGKRCKRIAGPSGYCSIPSHRPGNSAV